MKESLILHLSKITSLSKERIAELIEVPKDSSLGDYAFPCFSLAKDLKKNPVQIAQELQSKILKLPGFSKVQATGPYLNFFLDNKKLAEDTIKKVIKEKDKYGNSKIANKKTIIIECSSPNIAKPFGIGHLRSTIIGNSLAKIAKSQGAKVLTLNYLGDWGTQFGKLIVGFEKWGDKNKLKKDPISHLLELYVKVSADPELEIEAKMAFNKLEKGDKKYISIWKNFKELSLEDFNKVYKTLGVSFDIISGESFYNKENDKVLEEIKKKGLAKESEGALVVDLEKENLGICLIQKNDGSTLYATRDLAAAIDRHKKYKFDEMWYEVGAEQRLHFQQVFTLLNKLGYNWAKNCHHISHGLYLDQDGKKFATRKGKTVFMKDILAETQELAKQEIQKREKLSNKELEQRAKLIARAAIFYGDLKNYRIQDMIFDLDKFLAFEGDTGPYLLYSYARAKSILRKVKKSSSKYKFAELSESERNLISKISKYPDVVTQAYEQKTPHLIAGYAFQLAQAFNEFYHLEKVIGSEFEEQRLLLVESYAQVLKNAINLLGIETIEKM